MKMLEEIKGWYRKLLVIGLPPNAQFKEQLKIELSNQFIFMGLTCVLLHNIINLIFLQSFTDFCLTMVWFLVLTPSLLLNIAKRPFLARLNLAFGGIIAVFTLHILFGAGLKLESMYILFLVVAALFFESSLMIVYVLLAIGLLLLASVINLYIEPAFIDLVKPSGAFTRFIFSVVMISALIGKLVLKNRKYNTVIIDQNEYLNKYNQQLKSFNYIVSHDLKEPLRNIVGFSQLIKRKLDKGIESNEEYLDHIIRSTKQLNRLVDDLNEFTNSEEKELSKETFSIQELVNDIRISLAKNTQKDNIEISCKPFPSIISSKLALTIILRNLIENGIKYNNKENPKIIVDGEINNGIAQIRIKDNGIGIEEEYCEKIFEMFNRLNSGYQKGSGLGLNISQNLIKRLNGEIFIVKSLLNKGSTFQINFPVEIIESPEMVKNE